MGKCVIAIEANSISKHGIKLSSYTCSRDERHFASRLRISSCHLYCMGVGGLFVMINDNWSQFCAYNAASVAAQKARKVTPALTA
jgi:hypothetical protein